MTSLAADRRRHRPGLLHRRRCHRDPEDGKVINERPTCPPMSSGRRRRGHRRSGGWPPVIVAVNGICCGQDWTGDHRGHRHRLRPGDVLRSACVHRPGRRAGDGATGAGAARSVALRMAIMRVKHERMTAERAYGSASSPRSSRTTGFWRGSRDRRHRQPQCPTGGAARPAWPSSGPPIPTHEAEMLAEAFRERNLHTEDSLRGRRRSWRSAHRTGGADDRGVRDHPAGLRPDRPRRDHHPEPARRLNAFNRTM